MTFRYNYILDGKTPVRCDDVLEWGRWFETADRHVALDVIGDVTISTVFLGLDHSFGDGEPQLFETMTFGGKWEVAERERYATWDEAEAGHRRWVSEVMRTAPTGSLPWPTPTKREDNSAGE